MQKLIEAHGITKRFASIQALKGVDFDLLPGEVHALIGENGAGKSTLINILTGVLVPDAGELLVDGESQAFNSPHDARRKGIHVIHQELAFVPHLDVATNLALGNIPVGDGALSRLFGIVDRAEISRRADRALGAVGHPVDCSALVRNLGVAQLQLIEIARALNGEFRIIFFDEPTASLGSAERDQLFEHIRRLLKAGIGVVYTSHRLDEILELATRVTILKDGAVVGRGPAHDFDLDRIVRSITGGSIRKMRRSKRKAGEVVIEVIGLSSLPIVEDVSLAMREGEIVGLAGLIGAGRTELAECLFGARSFSGEIRLHGKPVHPQSPAEAIELGIAYGTEDRKAAGLFHYLSIGANFTVGALVRSTTAHEYVSARQWLRRDKLTELTRRLIASLQIRPPEPLLMAGTMSGGNQQKVVLGRLVAGRPRILVLDEPSRGVDVAAKAQIWTLIHQLADEGVAILAISSDIRELVGNVDRALVMRRGRLVADIAGNAVNEEGITRHAV